MDQDRNLLFAVFAAQLKRVAPEKLLALATAWSVDRGKGLAERVVEEGLLSERECHAINEMVERAIATRGSDPRATLALPSGLDGEERPSAPAPVDTPVAEIAGVHETSGRYTHPTEHARGGMGRVLIVHDEHLDRDIALKELLPGLGTVTGQIPSTPTKDSFPFIARFLQEARITGQLEHPSIVPVYELGHRLDGTLYYTMKLVRGRTLAQAIADAGSLEGRLKLMPHFVNLCQAIAYAHARGVIHRDIKPGNIMVGEFGETVVLDWGIAKIVGKEDLHAGDLKDALREPTPARGSLDPGTEYGQALGTLVYMPPEQARGDLDQIDQRSDIYSLGAVLYELLTGVTPFDLTELHPLLWRSQLIKKVIEEAPRAIAKVAPGVPPELAAIATRALEKDPAQRYQLAQELADEVQRFQTGALVSAYRYNVFDYVRRFARRHRSIAITVAASIVMIVLLSVVYGYKLRQSQLLAEEARRKSEATLYRSVMVVVPQYIASEQNALARKNLWAAPEDFRGWEWGQRLATVDRALVSLEGPAILDAKVSPSGLPIVLASSTTPDNLAHVWDLASGTELCVLKGHTRPVSAAALSGAVDLAATVSSEEKVLCLWDVPSGKLRTRAVITPGAVGSVAFSPDGSSVSVFYQKEPSHASETSTQTFSTASGEQIATPAASMPLRDVNPRTARAIEGTPDGAVRIVDTGSGAELVRLDLHGEKLVSCAFSADGARVATATDAGTVTSWDPSTGAAIATMDEVVRAEGYVELSDDHRFVLGCNFVTVHVWDTDTGETVFETAREKRCQFKGTFIHHGQAVLTREDNAVRLWDFLGPPEPYVVQGELGEEPSISRNGTRAAITTNANTVQLLDVVTGRELGALEGHTDHIYITQFSDDGARLVTASWDESVRVWDTAVRRPVARLEVSKRIRAAQFSDDDDFLWLFEDNGSVSFWNVASAKRIAEVVVPESEIVAAAFSPKTLQTVTVHADQTARLWNAATAASILQFKVDFPDHVRYVYLTPDSTHAIIASPTEVQVWNLATATRSKRYAIASRVNPAISPENANIVDGCTDDGKAAVIYPLDEKLSDTSELRLEGHEAPLRCVSFSPDGTRIVTGSNDKTARIWDARTGDMLATLEGQESAVVKAWFTPDGMHVITISADNALRVWSAYPYRSEQLPATGVRYPGTEDDPWKARYHVWKQQRYASWQATRDPGPPALP